MDNQDNQGRATQGLQMDTHYSFANFTLPSGDKSYYMNQLQLFANHMSDKYADIAQVDFCKRDSRSTLSITLIKSNRSVSRQRHFFHKSELLGFIVGYNNAKANLHI